MFKPAIALYLGETYASIGLFDLSQPTLSASLFEKSVFLPQVTLKNLLIQTSAKLKQIAPEGTPAPKVFIVTRYFDRLKQFRLGGSISQIIEKGFENSYCLRHSGHLSLAASQLIIGVETPYSFDETHIKSEIERIKKINPDFNKAVISISEKNISAADREKLTLYLQSQEIKVFHCTSPHNQSELRKTLLNAGSEGTKEEINQDFLEIFGEGTEVQYYCHGQFAKEFENTELFHSAHNFFTSYIQQNKLGNAAYFDIETFTYLQGETRDEWNSPWGLVPVRHYAAEAIGVHPFSELKLNHLSMLSYDMTHTQLEPGPVVAGRAIKPLILDLFYQELAEHPFSRDLFSNITTPALKNKIENLFVALVKGQKEAHLSVSIGELKNSIIKLAHQHIQIRSNQSEQVHIIGPLASIFSETNDATFNWPREILKHIPRNS